MSLNKITDTLLILCDRCLLTVIADLVVRSLVMLGNSEKECDRCGREMAIVGKFRG